MKMYVIRHAHKEQGGFFNPRLGHQDEPISAGGRRDAEKLHAYFADKPIAGIYVSGYQRTRQTIEHLAGQLALDPIVDERLNEIDNGLIEGLSDAEIRERYPEVWNAFIRRSADFRFPGGESGEEVRRRVASFLDEKRRQHAGGEIIAVSHEGLIRLTVCHVLGLPVYDRWNFQVDFCGIMEIGSREGSEGWKLIRFNQVCL